MFRLMLFAPFHQEIMLARVIETTPQWVRCEYRYCGEVLGSASTEAATARVNMARVRGKLILPVSVDFFQDIYIPAAFLPPNSI